MKTIIEMAREAGLVGGPVYAKGLEKFAELVRADERDWLLGYIQEHQPSNKQIVDAIRARSNT